MKQVDNESVVRQQSGDDCLQSLRADFEKAHISSVMSAYARTLRVYNDPGFAEMYFDKWRADLPEAQLESFSRRLAQGSAVLDAGCGPGHHAQDLHRRGHETVGLDLSVEALRLAKATAHGPHFEYGNMLHTSFPDSSFAGIWACASVIHLPEALLAKQFAEFSRVLMEGGIVAVTLSVDRKAHVDAFGRFFESAQTVERLTAVLRTAGLETVGWDEQILAKTTEDAGLVAKWGTLTARRVLGLGLGSSARI